jgi:hypothetical protein
MCGASQAAAVLRRSLPAINADASVRHGEHDFAISRYCAEYDFSAGQRVLNGVVQEILQNFLQPARVTGHIGRTAKQSHPQTGRGKAQSDGLAVMLANFGDGCNGC